MKFPRELVHHGLHYTKVMEELPDGKKILGYMCDNLPTLGTSRHEVTTWAPSQKYANEVMGSIRYSISQFVADYVRSVLKLIHHKGDLEVSDYMVAVPNVAPFDPYEKSWPEVIDHHSITYHLTMETTPNGTTLHYTCKELPELGTIKLKVDTEKPDFRYRMAVLGNIVLKINQFLVDFMFYLENQRMSAGGVTIFSHEDQGTSNQLQIVEG